MRPLLLKGWRWKCISAHLPTCLEMPTAYYLPSFTIFSFSDVQCFTLKCQLYFPEIYELLSSAKEHWGEWHKFPLPRHHKIILGQSFVLLESHSSLFRPSMDKHERCCSPALVGMATGSSIFPTMMTAILVYLHSASNSSALFVFLPL